MRPPTLAPKVMAKIYIEPVRRCPWIIETLVRQVSRTPGLQVYKSLTTHQHTKPRTERTNTISRHNYRLESTSQQEFNVRSLPCQKVILLSPLRWRKSLPSPCPYLPWVWMATSRTALPAPSIIPMIDLVRTTDEARQPTNGPLIIVIAAARVQSQEARRLVRPLAHRLAAQRVPDMRSRRTTLIVSTASYTGHVASSPALYSGLSFARADGIWRPWSRQRGILPRMKCQVNCALSIRVAMHGLSSCTVLS